MVFLSVRGRHLTSQIAVILWHYLAQYSFLQTCPANSLPSLFRFNDLLKSQVFASLSRERSRYFLFGTGVLRATHPLVLSLWPVSRDSSEVLDSKNGTWETRHLEAARSALSRYRPTSSPENI